MLFSGYFTFTLKSNFSLSLLSCYGIHTHFMSLDCISLYHTFSIPGPFLDDFFNDQTFSIGFRIDPFSCHGSEFVFCYLISNSIRREWSIWPNMQFGYRRIRRIYSILTNSIAKCIANHLRILYESAVNIFILFRNFDFI